MIWTGRYVPTDDLEWVCGLARDTENKTQCMCQKESQVPKAPKQMQRKCTGPKAPQAQST